MSRILRPKFRAAKRYLEKAIRYARHKASGGPEGTILFLLTNPRSGSTWLLDMLRCLPRVNMYPRYWIYRELGLHGRRYPRDLSGISENGREIEVSPGDWENIPWMDASLTGEYRDATISIEKIHPHFFDHEVNAFVKNVSSLSSSHNLKLIYQVRDPKETLVSFLEYKRRKPDWDYRRLDEIPPHLRRIYESIRDVSQAISGLVVDYETLENDVAAELDRIVHFATGDRMSKEDLRAVQAETSREEKELSETAFVGSTCSGALVDDYESYFATHSDELDRCYAAYNALRSST